MVGFIPSHLLPKKCPSSLDPFLHPLVSDVEDIFINGKFRAQLSINVSVLQATTESLKTEIYETRNDKGISTPLLGTTFWCF